MPEVDEVLKPVEIYEEDLEVLFDTLSAVYHFCLSQDLANQYKNLANKVQLSPLTRQVKLSQDRLKGYLDDARAGEDGTVQEA